MISNNVAFTQTSLCSLLLSLENPNDVRSVAIQASSKGSDQTARTRRLILAFSGHKYHIVGYIMSQLI